MATEIRAYTCLVPAGTLQAAPATFDVSFPPRHVDALQVIVPDGPAGLVGWRIRVGGVTVIPYLSDQWIVTAGEVIQWPLERYPEAGSWSVQAYNLGTVSHSVYFRFLLSYIGQADQPATYLPIDQLIGTVADDGA